MVRYKDTYIFSNIDEVNVESLSKRLSRSLMDYNIEHELLTLPPEMQRPVYEMALKLLRENEQRMAGLESISS